MPENASGSIDEQVSVSRNGSATNSPEAEAHETSRELKEVCDEMAGKVDAFLGAKVEGKILLDTQVQTRIAMEVIEEALRKYTYVGGAQIEVIC